jgi:hypothetical protein
MMKVFEGREFADVYDDASGGVFRGFRFIDCAFVSCWLSISDDADKRTTFRDVELVGASHINCGLNSAVVEDVIVEGLTSKRDPLFCRGAVFKHVVLRGDVDRIVLKPHPISGAEDQAVAKSFSEFRRAYYSDVDWALDISEVSCVELNIHSIPGDLVRRDPRTQAIVRRDSISANLLSGISWLGPEFTMSLELFLNRGDEDVVLIAPKKKPQFSRLVDEIERLRDAGIADRD